MSQIKLIVGLANTGAKYEETRHNAGEWLVNEIAQRYNVILKEEQKYFGKVAKINTPQGEVRLLVPTTFMNSSGKAVGALANFFHIKPEEILVAHDELDLPTGVVKLKQSGGHGGHNGLKDIITALGSKEFYRVRIGIGRPVHKEIVASYVLGKPSPSEQILLNNAVDEAARCVKLLFKNGTRRLTV